MSIRFSNIYNGVANLFATLLSLLANKFTSPVGVSAGVGLRKKMDKQVLLEWQTCLQHLYLFLQTSLQVQ
jgi:hypothetical protein